MRWLGISTSALPAIVLVAGTDVPEVNARRHDVVSAMSLETIFRVSLKLNTSHRPSRKWLWLIASQRTRQAIKVSASSEPAESYSMDLKVKRGDTIGEVFTRHGLSNADCARDHASRWRYRRTGSDSRR